MKNILLLCFGLFASSIGAATAEIAARDAKIDNVRRDFQTTLFYSDSLT